MKRAHELTAESNRKASTAGVNRRFAAGALAFVLIAVSASAVAGSRDGYDDSYGPDYYSNGANYDVAQVTRVDPIIDPPRQIQREECWNEPAYGSNDGYYRDNRSNAPGTVLGAVIGGALGNLAGKGDGRKAATIAGAVIGGSVGNSASRNQHARDGYSGGGSVQRCRTVTEYENSEDRVSGYNVTYRYAGKTYHAVTGYHPGKTIRVRVDVQPVDDNVAYR